MTRIEMSSLASSFHSFGSSKQDSISQARGPFRLLALGTQPLTVSAVIERRGGSTPTGFVAPGHPQEFLNVRLDQAEADIPVKFLRARLT